MLAEAARPVEQQRAGLLEGEDGGMVAATRRAHRVLHGDRRLAGSRRPQQQRGGAAVDAAAEQLVQPRHAAGHRLAHEVVRLGQAARITTETFRERIFEGRVTQISPIGVERDNVTNFEVRVSIDNPGNELKANMTANAEIVLEERAGALIVPVAAISYDAKRSASVDLLDATQRNGRRRIPIKVGISNGTRTQVIEGVKESDRVVLPS